MIGCLKFCFTKDQLTFYAPCLAQFVDLILFFFCDWGRFTSLHTDWQHRNIKAQKELILPASLFACPSLTHTLFFFPTSSLTPIIFIQNNDTRHTVPYAAIMIQFQKLCCSPSPPIAATRKRTFKDLGLCIFLTPHVYSLGNRVHQTFNISNSYLSPPL